MSASPADLLELPADIDEHAGDQHALGDPALSGLRRLEGFIRIDGVAVQIQAVVPVRPADQGKPVGSQVVDHVSEGTAQVLEETPHAVGIVVEGNLFLEDRPIAGLLEVGAGGQDQPERIVVEVSSDRGVASLGQRLVLVVGAAVLLLDGGHVQDPLSGSLGDLMHATQQILVGIPEAQAPADA